MRRHRLILTGAAVALIIPLVAAVAGASTFTLRIKKNVHVTNTPTQAFRVKPVDMHEAVVIGPAGYAVYTFQGETTHHLICKKTSDPSTNCWAFWPPLSVGSRHGISKPSGIKGKLGAFRNHGVLQVTLNGQPLYYFMPDLQSGNKRQATGDELNTFGSIWHVVVPKRMRTTAPSSPSQTNTTTSPPPSPW